MRRLCLVLVALLVYGAVASTADGEGPHDLGVAQGRRAGRRLIRRMAMSTSGAFFRQGGAFPRAGFQGNHEEEEEMALGEAAGNQQAGDNAESSKWWVKITGPKRLIDSAATKLCEAWKKDGECRHPFVKSQCGAVCASSVAEGAESDPGAPAR